MKNKAKTIICFIVAFLLVGSLLFAIFLPILKNDRGAVFANAAEAASGPTIRHISNFSQNSFSNDTLSATWSGTLYDHFERNNYYPYHLYSTSPTFPYHFELIKSDSDYIVKSPITPTDFGLLPYIYCDSIGRPYLTYSLYSTIKGKGRTVFKLLVLGKDSQGNLHNFYTTGLYDYIALNMGSFAPSFDPTVSKFPDDFHVTSTTKGNVAKSDISTLESSVYPFSYGSDFFFMPIVLPVRTSDTRDEVSGNIHFYPHFYPSAGVPSNLVLCDFPYIFSQMITYNSGSSSSVTVSADLRFEDQSSLSVEEDLVCDVNGIDFTPFASKYEDNSSGSHCSSANLKISFNSPLPILRNYTFVWKGSSLIVGNSVSVNTSSGQIYEGKFSDESPYYVIFDDPPDSSGDNNITSISFWVGGLTNVLSGSSLCYTVEPSKGDYQQGYQLGYSNGLNKGLSDSLTNPVTFFLEPVQAFLDTKIFGNFSIGTALNVVLFVAFALIFIKMFAGG